MTNVEKDFEKKIDLIKNPSADSGANFNANVGQKPGQDAGEGQTTIPLDDGPPCPTGHNPVSWYRLPAEIRATISRCMAVQKKREALAAAEGEEIPLGLGEAAPLRLAGMAAQMTGAPKRLLQVPLFGVLAYGAREVLNEADFSADSGMTVRYSGERLDQEDLTAFLGALMLYRQRRDQRSPLVTTSLYSFLRLLKLSTSKSNRERLAERLRRLSGGVLTIETSEQYCRGSLISTTETADGKWRIQPNSAFQPFFLGGEWQRLEWDVRIALGRNQLALALWGYFRTFRKPFPVKIATLRKRVGSSNSDLARFRFAVKAAMSAVASATASSTRSLEWRIDGDDNLCVEWRNGRATKALSDAILR